MSMRMTTEERQGFLAEARIGVIAVERPDRPSLAVPIWYGYEPGGDVVLWTDVGSVKEKLIREANRFSICVQQDTVPYKYVTAEGPVTSYDESPTEAEKLAIASRYVSAEDAQGYVDSVKDNAHVIIRMRPDRWLGQDQAKE